MSPLALTALLCLTQAPTPTADEGSADRVAARPAPPSAADSVVAAAFGTHIDTATVEQKAPSTPDWSSLAAPVLAIAGLGVLAASLTLRSRRRGARGQIRIVESASLGPKRSLVIADVLGDRLVLGVSEAGVVVLATKSVPAEAVEPDIIRLPPAEAMPLPMTRSYPRMGFFARLLGRTPKAQQFDDVLTESIEDRELRDKLASGMRSVVP